MKKQGPKPQLEEKVQQPVVIINDYRESAIQLWRARQYTYLIRYDNGIRIVKLHHDSVKLKDFRPLHYYVNGKPGPNCYTPEDAARRFLAWGGNSGITEAARRILENIVKGAKDMSNIEEAAAKQGDTKIPPAQALGAALEKATSKAPKKASTKNGTTASAKRPSKAKTVSEGPKPGPTPTKKGTAVTKTAKTPAKTAAKKKAPVKTASKPAPKVAAKSKPVGRATTMDREKTIKVLVDDNPRREGSQGYENWPKIKRYDGKKVSAYLDAGGAVNHLRFDINVGNVKLV